MRNILLVMMTFCIIQFLYAQEKLPIADSLNTSNNMGSIRSNILNNVALIQQVGCFNQAQISQSNNSGILPNVAEINQVGYNNSASSNQSGNGNLTLIGQYGTANSADINEVGNFNLAGVLQIGNSNTVQQDLIGNGLGLLVFQYGNDNFINQVQTEPTSIPLQIHQQGNGMKLTIIDGGIQ
jgi:minor curlin subunit